LPGAANHTPTIRLLGAQITTALTACGELRADLRSLDDEVEQVRLALVKGPPICEGCQELKVQLARLNERMSIIVGALAVLQILGTAIAAYLASGR